MSNLSQKKSDIWLHFSPLSDNKAKCNLCHSIYSHKGGSTSNLKKHLQHKHPSVLVSPEQISTGPSTSKSTDEGNYMNSMLNK